MDYNLFHAERANSLAHVEGKRVLVVGCNTGGDCTYFINFGARDVHGLDVVDEIGRDFQHERVTYHRASAEAMPLPDNSFDLVFCFATMEHVPDVASAFREMARVLAPGGVIYSIASPLWNSRNGHHYPQYFGGYPWAHLLLSKEQALHYLLDNNIEVHKELNGGPEFLVDYMYNPAMFNMRPAADYTRAVEALSGLTIVYHEVESEPAGSVPADIAAELARKGYSDAELRGVTHVLIATKPRGRWPELRFLPRRVKGWIEGGYRKLRG